MEEIGLKLKQTRDKMEISIEEAANDLQLSVEEIDNLEKGQIKFFDNIPRVKQLIEIYGKYLGLHCELLIDELNEYLFDYTSKVSLKAIKKEKKKEDPDKMRSPYTRESKTRGKVFKIIILLVLIIITIILFYYFKGGNSWIYLIN